MPPLLSSERLAWISGVALVTLIASGLIVSHQAHPIRNEAPAFSERNIFDAHNAKLPPLFPLDQHEYFGFGVAIVGLAVAAAGGIGGGGILLPVYTLVMRFNVKAAIPLTAVTVLGASLANNLINAPKKHPLHPSRPCIDWDLLLLLEPMTMAGTLVGAMLNTLLPAAVLVVLLLALLSLTSYLTLQKAKKLYDKETVAKRAAEDALRVQEQQKLLGIGSGGGGSYGAAGSSAAAASSSTKNQLHRQSTPNVSENTHQVWVDALKLTALFAVVTVINLAKGSLGEGMSASPDVVSDASELPSVKPLPHCGTTCFWTANFGILVLIVAFVLWNRRVVLSRLDTGVGAVVVSDISWDTHNTIKYPLYATVAGLVAGLFGIGGGMVMGPLLLALSVHPQVASATSACMIFFTSSTATISFMVFGLLSHDYAIACLLIGFVSALLGQSAIALLLQRYQRHSYIAFSIGIVIAVSAVCMTAESVMALRASSR
ncbi:hypothetical protein MPSEU_000581600 [Mayamaea pseudoterrestris]|nr:hypothetical protein MPSEU_000581600 [Mayamaea pseudoterrestris]